jgi:arabinose-5-phosphate isomerase
MASAPQPDTGQYIASGKRTLEIEAEAVRNLAPAINESFSLACELIFNCKGRVIVTGMGKSGHIARKIAATLASTGTPSFFVHPGEASHGDMGMITSEDVVIALSNSGNTSELVTLIPLIKRLGAQLITMTGNPESTLSREAQVNLDISVETEACPLNLAPTSSTTASLVMGDALAIALLEARGFTPEDFAFSHPGGALGRKLLVKVEDLMHQGDDMPQVFQHQSLGDALMEMTQKGLGITSVIDDDGNLIGVFTDGDLRRSLDQSLDVHSTKMEKLVHTSPKTISRNALAAEALGIMETHAISALIAVDDTENSCGLIHIHDILKAGVA